MRSSDVLRRGLALAAGFCGRPEGRAALALTLIASLAGCAVSPRSGYEALADSGAMPMAELPAGAGAVVAVLQNEAGGIVTQRIVLRGDPGAFGENAIVVKVNRSRGPADIDAVGPPTRTRIAAELDENFAGVDMRMSDSFSRNGFGPFGYAIGHPHVGVTCVYAWQWGLYKPPLIGQGPTGAPSMPTDPTSVRVRLCRTTIGEAEIVALLRGMQVYSPTSHAPYLDPASVGAEPGGDALAAAGVGYFVVPGVERPGVTRERLGPPRKRRKVAHHRRPRPERFADVEDRAAAPDLPPRGVVAPMPDREAKAPAPASSAFLPPQSATPAPRAHADLPMPGRAASAERAPTAKTSSVPLPN